MLLYGPPGTGKTSTILAVARKLYGSQYSNMILELNASDERGINVVRQQIQDFAGARSLSFGYALSRATFFSFGRESFRLDIQSSNFAFYLNFYRARPSVKLVLLDEADAMTKDAQFALRRGVSVVKTLLCSLP